MRTPLSKPDIDDLLQKRIPYFINSMLSHDLIIFRKNNSIKPDLKESCYGDSTILDPAFELGPIFGRVLLNFIGISTDDNYTDIVRKKYRDSDLRITDLGNKYEFCKTDHPSISQNKNHILTLIKLADKCIAHLTTVKSQESEHSSIYPAKIAIYQLVLSHTHDIDRNKIWWTTLGPKS